MRNHALAWDLVSAHLGSATTFGTGSLPSRWYSFCSRDKHAFDAPPMFPRGTPGERLYALTLPLVFARSPSQYAETIQISSGVNLYAN